MKIYIGTSGWQYYHWKNRFYPENLASKDLLKFYSKHFKTVEVNTSFYHLTKKSTFEKWYQESNKNFLFAVKLYRLFTHFRKLNLKKEDEKILKTFCKNVSSLKEKLGPILIQLPPSFKNKSFLIDFIKTLKRVIKKIFKNPPLIAIEIRNKNLLNQDVYSFFKKEKIIFVISDSPRWPTEIVKTTNAVYVRFHGKPIIFASKYSTKELKDYAEKIKRLKPKILFVYFNNDAQGYAIDNAFTFKRLFNLS